MAHCSASQCDTSQCHTDVFQHSFKIQYGVALGQVSQQAPRTVYKLSLAAFHMSVQNRYSNCTIDSVCAALNSAVKFDFKLFLECAVHHTVILPCSSSEFEQQHLIEM